MPLAGSGDSGYDVVWMRFYCLKNSGFVQMVSKAIALSRKYTLDVDVKWL
jgi:hypothetical protein